MRIGQLLVIQEIMDVIRVGTGQLELVPDLGISRIYYFNFDVLDHPGREWVSTPITLASGTLVTYLGRARSW